MRVRYQVSLSVFLLFSLLLANNAFCQLSAETTPPLLRIDSLLNQGETQTAWQILQEIPEDCPQPAERLWRMARTQYEMGRVAAQGRKRFFTEAEKYVRAALEKDPNSSESYKWMAIVLGAQSKYSNTKTQIRLSREVKENIDKAIALAPDDDIAYLVLSRWHYKLSGLGFFARTFASLIYGSLPKASLGEAESLLWKAIGLKDRIAHRYNLAKVYKRMGRNEEVRVQLQIALLLPVTFPEEAEELAKVKRKLEK